MLTCSGFPSFAVQGRRVFAPGPTPAIRRRKLSWRIASQAWRRASGRAGPEISCQTGLEGATRRPTRMGPFIWEISAYKSRREVSSMKTRGLACAVDFLLVAPPRALDITACYHTVPAVAPRHLRERHYLVASHGLRAKPLAIA